MKRSRRAERMKRHHRRHGVAGAINLVSLMDIFTILVFFLLVNSTEVELLPATRAIELPQSVSEERPRETVVVMVTDDAILVQGERVIGVAEALADEGDGIPALSEALAAVAANRIAAVDEGAPGPEATIMAARELPYRLMRRVMLACAEAEFGRVAFAVLQRAVAEEEAG